MFRYTTCGKEWKIFIKEQDQLLHPPVAENSSKYYTVAPLTGDKAKEFYENLLSEPPCKERKVLSVPVTKKPNLNKSKVTTSNKVFKDTDLLSMAQNNDTKNLEIFFSQKKEYNVDVVDEFGWTPLMCAACSGAEDAVKILLENKANPKICDKLGNTALKLAYKKNKVNIVNMLTNVLTKSEFNKNEDDEIDESPESFFCASCNENFKTDKKKHESSTLHLFNCKIKTATFYGIPECNKGFQLLLKEGWNKEKGLGPKGIGRKFPIKAVMKKDRKGIGAPDEPKNPSTNIQHTMKYQNNRVRNYNKWKEKNFERNFRLQFL